MAVVLGATGHAEAKRISRVERSCIDLVVKFWLVVLAAKERNTDDQIHRQLSV